LPHGITRAGFYGVSTGRAIWPGAAVTVRSPAREGHRAAEQLGARLGAEDQGSESRARCDCRARRADRRAYRAGSGQAKEAPLREWGIKWDSIILGRPMFRRGGLGPACLVFNGARWSSICCSVRPSPRKCRAIDSMCSSVRRRLRASVSKERLRFEW
jgi:hypothetical protein